MGGCTDTNNNATDFTVDAPTPRNSAGAANTCNLGDAAPAVVSTAPSDGSSDVDPGSILGVTFSEPVAVTPTAFLLDCGGPFSLTVSGGPTTFTLTPAAGLPAGATCHVTVAAASVSDVDTDDPPDHPAADFTFTFTVSGTPPTPIHAVQGAAHLSPLAGQVLNVGPAVVTAVASNGFYMQDPSPDGDDATSEGIFVFTNATPTVAVGDELVVRGTVSEFRPGCTPCTSADDAFNNLTQTELDGPSVSLRGHGRALPPPVVLGTGPGERRQPNDDHRGRRQRRRRDLGHLRSRPATASTSSRASRACACASTTRWSSIRRGCSRAARSRSACSRAAAPTPARARRAAGSCSSQTTPTRSGSSWPTRWSRRSRS